MKFIKDIKKFKIKDILELSAFIISSIFVIFWVIFLIINAGAWV